MRDLSLFWVNLTSIYHALTKIWSLTS